MAQRKRVMEAFAWITGDKALCDYRPIDAQHFADTLNRLPKDFRWGTPAAGSMSRPFTEVLAEQPPLNKADKRWTRAGS
jgi:hypothetical protein